MKLHILTAVSRPWNLERVAASLAVAARETPMEISWHWRFDLEREHIGGQALKNAMLDDIADGWVWCLDDDTLAHPDVLKVVGQAARGDAVVVSQKRTDGRTLTADPGQVRVGYIDIGPAFLKRSLIGDIRIPETYEGDFHFLHHVLVGARVAWVHEPLSLHNAISGVDVSQ